VNTTPTQDKLKIYPAGRGLWRCESGQNNYKIVDIGAGRYQCNCPARVECRHVKQLKGLLDIQATSFDSAQDKPIKPTERRLNDRRTSAPSNIVKTQDQVLALRAELTQLLYGLKDEVQSFGNNGEVERLRAELSKVLRLGFGSDRRFVFLNDRYNCTWYTMKGETHTPIPSKFLFGYIRRIEFKERKGNVRPSHHLHLTVEADQTYVIITGYDNHFAKGVIATVAQMRPKQLQQPVWIQPQKTGLTTLCNLHQDGVLIRARYSADTDWRSISIKAMENLRGSSQYQNQ
jgi:hypothetical protein